MRWFAAILAVLLVGVGALFGAGYFFLPSAMTVEKSVVVERPRAAVFAILENLDTFTEWTPWTGADPQAIYTVEGEAGVGQTASWVTKGGIGPGAQTIVRLEQNARVESVLDLGQRGAPKLVWSVARDPAGAKVSWSMTSDCTANPVYVPCRYMNLLSRQALEEDFEAGLQRLKALAEQLPPVDFEPLEPQFLQAEPTAYAFVENDVTRDRLPEDASADAIAEGDATYAARVRTAIDESLAVVAQRLKDAGAAVSGPPVMVTMTADEDRLVFRVGYPFTGPTPAADPRVAIGATPEGRALRFVHTGPASAMRQTYVMIGAYLAAHRIQTAGGPWEIHVQPDGDPVRQRREIYIPIR